MSPSPCTSKWPRSVDTYNAGRYVSEYLLIWCGNAPIALTDAVGGRVLRMPHCKALLTGSVGLHWRQDLVRRLNPPGGGGSKVPVERCCPGSTLTRPRHGFGQAAQPTEGGGGGSKVPVEQSCSGLGPWSAPGTDSWILRSSPRVHESAESSLCCR